jgi:Cof subfamily protein (haloacid dehalogenase superfamily)
MDQPRHLYISDLDGTLLDASGTLSPRTRRGLLRLLEQGVDFSVASARSYFSIKSIFGDFPFRLPIIEFNGGFVTDYQTGEHLEMNCLDESLAEGVFERILAAGQRPFVSTFDGEKDCLYFDELINAGMIWYERRRRRARDPRLQQTRALSGALKEAVVSFTVMAQSEERIVALRDELEAAYGAKLQLYLYENTYFRGSFWLTVHDKAASKHIAMQRLRDRWLPGALITAAGDNFNDLEMLRFADRAVAVENAVAEVRAIAHLVVGHHCTDSVIRFVEDEVRMQSA